MALAKICEIDGCCKHVRARGLCAMHYGRTVRHGDPHDGGRKPSVAGRHRPLNCGVAGCEKPHQSKGFCAAHYWRHRTGKVIIDEPIAERRHGEKWVCSTTGYIVFTDRSHPEATGKGRVLEHRAVMAVKLGRKLLTGESVHHINGDRADNRPENLELWVTSQPSGQRPEDLMRWAREILARYGPEPANC